MNEQKLSIDELAEPAGVSRRIVRYYIQEGLLPEPLGVGRGRHYDRTHLERRRYLKEQEQAGRLDHVKPEGPSRRDIYKWPPRKEEERRKV